MAKIFECIDDMIEKFIKAQHLFFVATAPLDAAGHVNLSPKGLDCLRILDSKTVAYLDLTGSGIETIAHLRENGRIVLMFCAFQGPPKIVRLHGRGEVFEQGDSRFDELRPLFPSLAGTRSIIVVSVNRVADSCGYAIPLFSYEGERSQLIEWAENKGEAAVEQYRSEKNRMSIDGLPGLSGPRAGRED